MLCYYVLDCVLFWNTVPNAIDWYTPMHKKGGFSHDKVEAGIDNMCDDKNDKNDK